MEIPRRPPVIVRAPEREEKQNEKKVMDSSDAGGVSPDLYSYINKTAAKPKHDITVYTNTGVCKHGPALLAAMWSHDFNHIDVSQTKPPSWLPGTPTLVYKKSVYCGDAAFAFVQTFELPKSVPASDGPALGKAPVNPFSKKISDDSAGCGLSSAFAPPPVVDVDESKFSESTDDAMQRLLAGRR